MLRLGLLVARAIAIMCLLMVACHPTGDLAVRVNGELVGRPYVLTRAYPAILGVAAAALALAYGLRLGRSWARPATFVFWVGFIGLLVVVGGREQVSKTLVGTIPVAAASLFYLYFNPSVLAYYADLKRRKAHESELVEWLDRPHSRERGA